MPVGAPLGLLAGVEHERIVVKPQGGDLVLLCSDGAFEGRILAERSSVGTGS